MKQAFLAAAAMLVLASPAVACYGVIDCLATLQAQSEAQNRAAVYADTLRMEMRMLPRATPEQRHQICDRDYPAALRAGLLDIDMNRQFFKACMGP